LIQIAEQIKIDDWVIILDIMALKEEAPPIEEVLTKEDI